MTSRDDAAARPTLRERVVELLLERGPMGTPELADALAHEFGRMSVRVTTNRLASEGALERRLWPRGGHGFAYALPGDPRPTPDRAGPKRAPTTLLARVGAIRSLLAAHGPMTAPAIVASFTGSRSGVYAALAYARKRGLVECDPPRPGERLATYRLPTTTIITTNERKAPRD